jgi:hypothetical protein
MRIVSFHNWEDSLTANTVTSQSHRLGLELVLGAIFDNVLQNCKGFFELDWVLLLRGWAVVWEYYCCAGLSCEIFHKRTVDGGADICEKIILL